MTSTISLQDYINKLMDNLVVVEKSSACFNSVYDGEYVVGLTYEDELINHYFTLMKMVENAEQKMVKNY